MSIFVLPDARCLPSLETRDEMDMDILLKAKPRMPRRVAVLLLSVIMMGICVAVFDQLGFGTDPCSVMNLAVSRLIGWSFGNWQLLVNALMLAVIIGLGEVRRIGLGTLANMVLVGYAADAALWVLNHTHPLTGETMLVKLIVFVPTMAAFLVAVAFYSAADLGVAPYDAMPQIIAGRQKRFSFTAVRVTWDVSFTVLGFLAGGTVGLVTVAVCFFLGPVIAAIAKRCTFL